MDNIVRPIGQDDVATYVDASFLQMFIWERFGNLAPKANEFDNVDLVFSKVQGVGKPRPNNSKYKPGV